MRLIVVAAAVAAVVAVFDVADVADVADVVAKGLILLAASQSVRMVYISFSVNSLPFSTLYNGFFIVCTILSMTPLCCGDLSVLWYHLMLYLFWSSLWVDGVFRVSYKSFI